MNFKQAKEELKKLAAGRYFGIRYGQTCHTDGTEEQTCYLYIDTGVLKSHGILVEKATWEEAFAELVSRLTDSPIAPQIIDEDIEELEIAA